jgi:predicted ferric reductase
MLPSLAPDVYLLLSRASAFMAYGLLWLAMALGVAIHNKLSRIWPGGPAAYALHRYASLAGLVFMSIHVLLLLGHPALGYSIANALLPFASSSYRPLMVGLLGKVSFYLMGIVGLSFYIRSRLGQRLWRLIHYLSFAVFLLALIHGLFAGSDSPTVWARGVYLGSGGILLILTVYRLWLVF